LWQTGGGATQICAKVNVVSPAEQVPAMPFAGGGSGICNVHCFVVPSTYSASVYIPAAQALFGDCNVMRV
jgi:hypothetical protein